MVNIWNVISTESSLSHTLSLSIIDSLDGVWLRAFPLKKQDALRESKMLNSMWPVSQVLWSVIRKTIK